jgi:tetratricopeptide (TPR) repeat protein
VKRRAGLVVALAVAVSGCSRAEAPLELRPTTMPDISRMAAPVREQLQAQSERLEKARRVPAVPGVELAALNGEMGRLLLAAEAYAAAEPFLVNAQQLAPDDARWTYYLAHVYRAQGQSMRAAALFEAVLRSRPEDVAALVWLGNAYLEQGRPEAAEPLFARALAGAPRAAAPHLGLGRVALALRAHAKAIEHLEQVLSLEPRASAAHYPLAMAYRGIGDVERAEAHLGQRGDVEASMPDPLMQELSGILRSPAAYEARGMRAIDIGNFAGAVAQFRLGLELAPDSAPLRHRLATALSLVGDVPGAVRELEDTLRRAPDYAPAHYTFGVLDLGAGRFDQALDRFASAVRGDPAYGPARLQLANTLRQRGRFESALQHYAYLIDHDPRLGEARLGHAVTLVRLRRYPEARRHLVEAVRIFPGHPGFADALARVYAAAPDAKVRDGQLARALAQQLVARGPTLDGAETMAMALAEVGEFEAAASWQRDAIAAAKRAGLGPLAARMGDNLRLYEKRQPCRTPWRDDPRWQASP